MLQIIEKRDMQKQCLCISDMDYKDLGNENERFNQEQMLVNNNISGLLAFTKRQSEGEMIYYYDISGMESVASVYEKELLRKKELENIFEEVLKIITSGREYLLEDNNYVINCNTIYLDEKRKIHIPYYYGHGQKLRNQLEELAAYFMDRVDYHDEGTVVYIYSLYMRIKEENCTVEDLLGFLSGKKAVINNGSSLKAISKNACGGDRAENPCDNRVIPTCENKKPASSAVRNFDKKADIFRLIQIIVILLFIIVFILVLKTGVLNNPYTGKPDIKKTMIAALICLAVCAYAEGKMLKLKRKLAGNKGDRREMEEVEEKTELLFNREQLPGCELISEDEQRISVLTIPFFIGSDSERMDYTLMQKGVSRAHLKIDWQEENFVIVDLNSTNGTFINGNRLIPHTPERIKAGDELIIGRKTYRFCT